MNFSESEETVVLDIPNLKVIYIQKVKQGG